jgi:hypothetical protein
VKHIGWFTLFFLGLFVVSGLSRNGLDRHARDLIQISESKSNGIKIENEVFDNHELRHLATLQQVLKKTRTEIQAPGASGELEDSGNSTADLRDPAQAVAQ